MLFKSQQMSLENYLSIRKVFEEGFLKLTKTEALKYIICKLLFDL